MALSLPSRSHRTPIRTILDERLVIFEYCFYAYIMTPFLTLGGRVLHRLLRAFIDVFLYYFIEQLQPNCMT